MFALLYEEWQRRGHTIESCNETLLHWLDEEPAVPERDRIDAKPQVDEEELRRSWGATPEAIEGQRLMMSNIGRPDAG